MLRVREGEVEQLGILFQRYRKLLLSFFNRCTRNHASSEDLVQDVFVRILKYRHTFGDGSEFAAWIYQIARNTHFNHWRKRKRETPLIENEHVLETASEEPRPDEALERRLEITLVHRALEAMSDEKRELLLLSRFHQFKYRQIAERLRCDVGTVKVRIFRATREMEKRLRKLAAERAPLPFPRVASLGIASRVGF